MRKIEIPPNTIFTRLVTLGPTKYSKNKVYYKCVCDCGSKLWVESYKLRTGHSQSCGCMRLEINALLNIKHGFANKNSSPSEKRTYKTWQEMKNRCLNKNNKKWERYGGRGIKICQRWLDSFENFVEDMGLRPANRTIDRINNNGNYCKENCKWSTVHQQNRNRENTIMITYKGKTQCMTDWAKELGIREGTLQQRIYRGMNPVKALEM